MEARPLGCSRRGLAAVYPAARASKTNSAPVQTTRQKATRVGCICLYSGGLVANRLVTWQLEAPWCQSAGRLLEDFVLQYAKPSVGRLHTHQLQCLAFPTGFHLHCSTLSSEDGCECEFACLLKSSSKSLHGKCSISTEQKSFFCSSQKHFLFPMADLIKLGVSELLQECSAPISCAGVPYRLLPSAGSCCIPC